MAPEYIDDTKTADSQVIEFKGLDSGQASERVKVTLEGLEEDSYVAIEDSDMILNLNDTTSSRIELSGSDVLLWGETKGKDFVPTGMMTSLAVAVAADSTLELGASAAFGMTEAHMTGPGDLLLSGNPLADGAVVDASEMSGDLRIEGRVLEDVASLQAGEGDDTIFTGVISATDTAEPVSLHGGRGDDTLIITRSMTVPREIDGSGQDLNRGETVDTDVRNFETVVFESYSEVDSGGFWGARSFVFDSGGDISRLDQQQSVIATSGSIPDNEGELVGSPLTVRNPNGSVFVTADFEASSGEVLDFRVYANNDVKGGGLSISGSGSVRYEDTGREFDTINASFLEGDLEFSGANYVQETISLGQGDDTIAALVGSIYGSDGNRVDSIYAFEVGKDTLEGVGELTSTSIEATSSLEEAFDSVADSIDPGSFVAFEREGNTYIYADTETQAIDEDTGAVSDRQGLSYNDFAIELIGVTGEIEAIV